MQVPKRRYDKIYEQPDPHLTREKYDEFKARLDRLVNVTRFQAMAEVARLAEMGDFSENAAYQMAKGKLRGINARIIELENILKRAVIIGSGQGNEVELGSTVTVDCAGKEKSYRILGSSETDPLKGVISHNSPFGSALLGRRVGDNVRVRLTGKIIECKIIKIA